MPKYVKDLLVQKFGQERADRIEQHWDMYTDLRFSTASTSQILNTARMVERELDS